MLGGVHGMGETGLDMEMSGRLLLMAWGGGWQDVGLQPSEAASNR